MEWLKKLLEVAGLGHEEVEKVLEGAKDTAFIPKSRFDEKNEEVKSLKEEISNRDKQIKELSKLDKDNEALQTKLKELEQANGDWSTKYDNLQLDTAIKSQLHDAHNVDSAMKLLSRDGLALKDGKVEGLEDAVKAFREQHTYLFKQAEEPQQPSFKGGKPADGTKGGEKTDDVSSAFGNIFGF